MKNKETIHVQGTEISVMRINNQDYICISDMIKAKDNNFFIANWLRNRNTLEYIGIWEQVHNPNFNYVEFDIIKSQAGLNRFRVSIKDLIQETNLTCLHATTGRYGGTYAHKDIAFEFAMWISPEFKIYIVKEFQYLKEQEQKALGWSAKRELAKINYHIHTSAIKQNLIPAELIPQQTSIIYATEADVLNIALFGITAKQWRETNPEKDGNMRDYASINELICLSNMENLNAVFINEGLSQKERLIKLNQIAIRQMQVLVDVENRKLLN
ncbi:MAG: KilA-N domain-containing protein [Bacteroidales bacterium]|nr:KilA-N domain-containing protein [Bacteroidales bacterium]